MPAEDAERLLEAVPRETREKLILYDAELRRWQRIKNLVGPKTLDAAWTRHFADSLQLAPLADGAVWADLGSGAGFPGLVLAIAKPGIRVHLVESDSRRCAFLRHVARSVAAPAIVWEGRVDAMLPRLDPRPDVVTARAVAPLVELLDWSQDVLTTGAVGLFPKGRDHRAELTRARESWRFAVDAVPSCVEPDARILRVTDFEGRVRRESAKTQ